MLSVFLFHLQPSLLPGGFLGVDVFFVISGYLISGIIVRENHLGTFSLTNFYGRRVKRIFPALFVVLALASVPATFLLTPETYVRYMQSARYASGQLSNFFFAQKVGYFEEGFSGQPLLHTWSLGVEEQFYLVWPLLLLLAVRFLPGRIVGISILVLGIASFALSYVWTTELPEWAFFSPLTRAWELAAGALI